MATFTSYCSSGSKANRYGVQLIVTENSYSISTNKSNITASIWFGGASAFGLAIDSTASSFYGATCTGNIYVNNTLYATGSQTPSISYNTKVCLATWTGDVAHNSDGTLSLTIGGEFTGGMASQASYGYTGGTVKFTTIPRYTTISSITATAVDEDSVKVAWSTTDNVSKVVYYYKKDSSSGDYTKAKTSSDLSTKSGNYTISGLTKNTKYDFYVVVTRKDSGLTTTSSTKTATTYNDPTVTKAPNFTIESNPTLTVSNPLKRTCKIYLYAPDGSTAVGYVSTTSTGSVEVDTSNYYAKLYSTTPVSTNKATYTVKLNGTKQSVTGQYSASSSKAVPSFTVTGVDTNETTINLTNDSTKIVTGKSIVKLTATISRASASNDTSLTSVSSVTYGSSSFTQSGNTWTLENIKNPSSATFSVKAINNRGYSKSVNATGITLHPYFAPSISSLDFARDSQTGSQMLVTFNSKVFNQYFDSDSVNYNTTTVSFKTSLDGSTWSSTVEIPSTSYTVDTTNNVIKGNNISLTNPLDESGEWDYMKKYYFQLIIQDRLNTVSASDYVVIGIPYFDWYNDGTNNIFNVNGINKTNEYPTIGNAYKISSGEVDFNDLTNAGTYYINSSTTVTATNKPGNASWGGYLIVLQNASSTIYLKQIWTPSHNTYGNIMFVRSCSNGTWSPWANPAYPVGSICQTSTNTNPSTMYGGTWSLIRKSFTSSAGELADGNGFTKTSNCSASNICYVRNGETLRLRIRLTTAVAISDDTVTLGTLNFETFGISDHSYNSYLIGYSDDGNALCMCSIESTSGSGKFNVIDVLNKSATGTIPANNTIYVDFTIPLTTTKFIDSFCDTFTWKRTD